MAKVAIVGEAVVITSSVKMEDLKKVEKYRPEALTLYGGEDGKEPIYKIGTTGKTSGSINGIGAEFGGETHDENKYATITLCNAGAGSDVRTEVAEKYGAAILKLNKLEANIPAVLAEIDAERATVLENITVVQ